jgi:hypothetical protein
MAMAKPTPMHKRQSRQCAIFLLFASRSIAITTSYYLTRCYRYTSANAEATKIRKNFIMKFVLFQYIRKEQP